MVRTTDAPRTPATEPIVELPAAQPTSSSSDGGSALGGLILLAVVGVAGFGGVKAVKRKASAPATATVSAAPVQPAAWLPDPTRRHELRYWNGTNWTANISDAGVVGTDPLA